MSRRADVLICSTIGSLAGGYLPMFFGADVFSFWSLITSAIGGLAGVWLGFRLSS